ncbi:MgtC/SapB family protein [Lepagella muris]|jgi:putative Mg2+ transporter-C (MgtC) family protein|uniref:MgtC/SapB family protein n=1 Tax=Lepagella muris TaxID=3032870 RepID=A0AC61RCW0_9BACT|nr:MgtC/SapB family protein [Lepagella muris]ROT03619.1 MgtC/SapB family protein [Muribaculaceae bacterium Isolate-037 (Harlan)]TGY77285.1 MgtC/SapB family protein [Lepagella muris]THG49490.1 MgtC/SapB family protein [Bacteroidales bacterium]TKC54765.1 MgtC/SapB family protein [Bacteroidales bacterium]
MVECVINFLTEVYADINSLEVNMVSSMFRLLLSMILGMVVGAERKRKGQVAGIRTFALISMGACLAMLLSIYVPQVYLGLKNGDPGRIAAQVITGIGFIGGGAMIHMKGAVKGLTTAAGIWMTAIIGMAVGIGMYMCSIGATLLILMTLVSFEQYEKRKKMGQESKVIGLTVEGVLENIDDYKRVFNEADVHLSTFFVEYDYDRNVTELNFVVLAHVYTDLMPLLSKIRGVNPTKKLTLSSQLDI